MAAIVQIISYYGVAPGTKTVVTTQRYNTAIPSQRDPGLQYPNNIPPEGETYRSCWMFTGAEVIGGTYSQLGNWRWGTSGNIKTAWHLGSGMVQVAKKANGDHGLPVASYFAPTGVAGLKGYDILDPDYGIPFYAGESCEDADNYDADNPFPFDSTVITPQSASKITKLVTHQLVTEDDTEFGENDELQTFIKWQEI